MDSGLVPAHPVRHVDHVTFRPIFPSNRNGHYTPELFASSALHEADLVVLTIDDRHAALRATAMIRTHSPDIAIVARARDLATCDALYRAGVNQAYPETLEASLRLGAESLEILGIPGEQTDLLLRGVRSSDYALVRTGPEAAASSDADDPPG